MELDQLYKISSRPFTERLALLDQYPQLVDERDDLYLERITLLNNLRQYKTARELLAARKFHPWEGGEGKVMGNSCFAISNWQKKLCKMVSTIRLSGFYQT